MAFAKAAENEGKKGLAQLFRVAAEAETIHALKHLQNAGEVKSSEENLKSAIAGETHEFTEMYPEFIEQAKAEEQMTAFSGFNFANEVEKEHGAMFQDALGKNGEIEEKEYYICSVCGHPHLGQAPERCPICGAPAEKFYLFQ